MENRTKKRKFDQTRWEDGYANNEKTINEAPKIELEHSCKSVWCKTFPLEIFEMFIMGIDGPLDLYNFILAISRHRCLCGLTCSPIVHRHIVSRSICTSPCFSFSLMPDQEIVKVLFKNHKDKTELLPNEEQYNIIMRCLFTTDSLFITGEAGSGKSFIIKRLIELSKLHARPDKEGFIVCSSTGVSAYNLGEGTMTFHSLFGTKPIFTLRKDSPLYPRGVTVIGDEISMIPPKVFELASQNCQSIRGVKNLPFGGLRLILFGDFFQLPPVINDNQYNYKPTPEKNMTTSPYFNPITGVITKDKVDSGPKMKYCFETVTWKHLFQYNEKRPNSQMMIHLLSQHRQMKDIEYYIVLSHIRVGLKSSFVKNFIRKKLSCRSKNLTNISSVGNITFQAQTKDQYVKQSHSISHTLDRMVKLRSRKFEVENINNEELEKLPGKVIVYQAEDGYSKYVNNKKSNETDPYPGLNYTTVLGILNSQTRAPETLRLKIGAFVMLIQNIDTGGLFNGATGTVIGTEKGELISQDSIRVQFKGITNPVTIRRSVFPVIYRVQVKGAIRTEIRLFRRQFPLMLGYSTTIHKSQGLTLYSGDLSLDNIFENGQAYVGMSRFTEGKNFELSGRGSDMLANINADPNVLEFYRSTFGYLNRICVLCHEYFKVEYDSKQELCEICENACADGF